MSAKYAFVAVAMLILTFFLGERLSGPLTALPRVFTVALLAVPFMAAIGLAWSLFLVASPLSHPTLRRLEKLSPGSRATLIDAFEGGVYVVRHGPLYIGKETAVLLHPWGLEARLIGDLAWVHPTLQTIHHNGATVRRDLLITLRFRRDPPLEIGVSTSDLATLTATLKEHHPAILVGWSRENEQAFKAGQGR